MLREKYKAKISHR